MSFTLWLSMIIKNEIDFLNKHFWIIYELFDDIIIVDTGSKDWWPELLKEKYWIKVYNWKLDNNWSLIEARNKSIKLNNSDLILILDADEFISREDVLKIRKINLKTGIYWYFLKFLDYRYWEPFEDYKLSLLKKWVFFDWYVHANPQQFLRKYWYKAEYLHLVELKHFPNFFLKKTKLYIEQMLYDIKQKWWNNRIFWFLWYSYFKIWEIDKAINILSKVINNDDINFPVEKLNSYLVVTYIYYKHKNNIEKALELIREAKSYFYEKKDDFEVKINFRLENKINEIEKKIQKNETFLIYEFSF